MTASIWIYYDYLLRNKAHNTAQNLLLYIGPERETRKYTMFCFSYPNTMLWAKSNISLILKERNVNRC